jgi:hypothetical protein
MDLCGTGFSLSAFEFLLVRQKSKENRLKPILLNSTAALSPCILKELRCTYLSQIIQWKKMKLSPGLWPRTRTLRSGPWRRSLPIEWGRLLACLPWRPKRFASKACSRRQLPRTCREQMPASGHSSRASRGLWRKTGMPRNVHRDRLSHYSH